MNETVYRETVPYYLRLRKAMSDAHLNITFFRLDRETRAEAFTLAARMLNPDSEQDTKGLESSGVTPDQVRLDAMEALGVPEFESFENVDLLLGRASLTLMELVGRTIDEDAIPDDLLFTETVVKSMRDFAAAKRSTPTDTVITEQLRSPVSPQP